MFPPNSHIQALIPNGMVLGGVAFGRILGPEAAALTNGINALIGRDTER